MNSPEQETQPDEYKSSDNSNECGHKPDEEIPEEIDSNPDQSVKKKSSRSSQFSSNEILLLARAWKQVNTDAVTSNNQKDKAFWLRVQQQQNSLASLTNKLNASSPGYTKIPEDHFLNSLKGHWKKSLHLAVNKVVGIVSTNPLVLGMQNDASYYAQMRGIYAEPKIRLSLIHL